MAENTSLLGDAAALSLLETALTGSPADETELVLVTDDESVTRYANSEIHQSVNERTSRVAVRVAVGRATARVFTNDIAPGALRETVALAVSLARLQGPNPRFQPLPSPALGGAPDTEAPLSFFASTAAVTPRERAEQIGVVIDAAASAGLEAFGTASTTISELAVVSSTGIRAYAATTRAYLKALVEGAGGSGFADALSRDAETIDAAAVARRAVDPCLRNHDQQEIGPGDYEAIFLPNAVADMLRFPAVHGMGARGVLDGASFMAGRIGERVTGAQISIWDDPADPRCLPLAIDFEGLPARRVAVIEEGIARGPVYDAETAHEAGVRSTGHAADPWRGGVAGPAADHIIMATGDATLEAMIGRVRHGVLVTRFHYTHCPDPRRVIATGTTRDGTFLIRDGQITGALKNLRLEMRVLDLLASLQETGAGQCCQDWWAANGMGTTNYFVPTMRFARCTFTGVTTF